jgi:hypothetical protein
MSSPEFKVDVWAYAEFGKIPQFFFQQVRENLFFPGIRSTLKLASPSDGAAGKAVSGASATAEFTYEQKVRAASTRTVACAPKISLILPGVCWFFHQTVVGWSSFGLTVLVRRDCYAKGRLCDRRAGFGRRSESRRQGDVDRSVINGDVSLLKKAVCSMFVSPAYVRVGGQKGFSALEVGATKGAFSLFLRDAIKSGVGAADAYVVSSAHHAFEGGNLTGAVELNSNRTGRIGLKQIVTPDVSVSSIRVKSTSCFVIEPACAVAFGIQIRFWLDARWNFVELQSVAVGVCRDWLRRVVAGHKRLQSRRLCHFRLKSIY